MVYKAVVKYGTEDTDIGPFWKGLPFMLISEDESKYKELINKRCAIPLVAPATEKDLEIMQAEWLESRKRKFGL